jgi:uncharacterized protein with NRDE domain
MNTLAPLIIIHYMCLVFIAHQVHEDLPFVMLSNRDEFYHRPTLSAHFWDQQPWVLGGKDLEAGGTWLGLHKAGKLACVTNYRDLRNLKSQAPSRGALVADFLHSPLAPTTYLEQVAQNAHAYNGFNLLTYDTETLAYFSNYGNGVVPLSSGIYGLSNALLDDPWPKVVSGKTAFAEALKAPGPDVELFFNILRDTTLAPDHQLPDTGIGLEKERILSSRFIESPGYGTRCSTVVWMDAQKNWHFIERTYQLPALTTEERAYVIPAFRPS